MQETGTVGISLFNLMGQELQIIEESNLVKGIHNYKTDVRDLPAGPYLIQFTTKNNQFQKMVIIQ